ncbi:hypothetical protein [Nostocoides veronense]
MNAPSVAGLDPPPHLLVNQPGEQRHVDDHGDEGHPDQQGHQ